MQSSPPFSSAPSAGAELDSAPLARTPAKPGSYTVLFTIKKHRGTCTVAADDVLWFEATGNYVQLHLEEEGHLLRSTMNAIARELDPDRFLRIHRGIVVNLLQVDRTRYVGDHRYRFDLSDGRSIRSGRSFKARVAAHLARGR